MANHTASLTRKGPSLTGTKAPDSSRTVTPPTTTPTRKGGRLCFCSAWLGGDAYRRRPVECRAVGAERWPVHRLIACAAGPGGVSAAVAEASLMTDQYGAGAEGVSARAARRRPRDPRSRRRPHQLTHRRHKDNGRRSIASGQRVARRRRATPRRLRFRRT
jgi:hypothetical protein